MSDDAKQPEIVGVGIRTARPIEAQGVRLRTEEAFISVDRDGVRSRERVAVCGTGEKWARTNGIISEAEILPNGETWFILDGHETFVDPGTGLTSVRRAKRQGTS